MTPLQRTAAVLATAILLATPLCAGEADDEYKFQTELGDKETSLNTVPNRQGGVRGPMVPGEFMAVAANLQAGAMEPLDKLITVESYNASEMEKRWQRVCQALFGRARDAYDEAERLIVARKENPAPTQPLRDEMRKFMDDLEQNGYACMMWRRHICMQKNDLKDAVDDYPTKISTARDDVKKAQEAILSGQALLARTKLSVNDIENQLDKIRVACNQLQWAGRWANETCANIKDTFGDKPPEMRKSIQQTLTDWKAVAARYTSLSKTLSPYPPKWADKMKTQWDDFLKVRKQFDTTYAPLLGGKLFDDLSLFKGVAYGDIEKIPDDIKTKLIAKREALKHKEADEAAIQKALEEERRISAKEKEKWREYDDTWGHQAARDIENRTSNIDGPSREREIRLIEARIKSPTLSSIFGSAARAATGSAANAIRNAWHKAKKQADAEYDTWWKARTERRAKLGLKPDWD